MEKRKLILVADDSRTARQYLCSILEKSGFETIQAVNGIEALNIASEKKPSLMILDLLMPEMDGFEVLKKLNELKTRLPVIILSADIQDEVKQECYDLGVKGFINKPFKEADLISAIMGAIK